MSLYYLNEHAGEVIEEKGWKELEIFLPFPRWISFRVLASAMKHGEEAIDAAEKAVGGPFRWASEFENVHSTWNVVEHGFEYAGERWKGSEQLFQCLKWGQAFDKHKSEFAGLTAVQAFELGRNVPIENVDAWNRDGRVQAMRLALSLKFGADKALQKLLLETGDHPLVSIKADKFWGIGFDGRGENMLGKLLQELRTDLMRKSKLIN